MSTNPHTIHIIDDDFAMEAIVDALSIQGLKAIRHTSIASAKQHLNDILQADVVVLDLMMTPLSASASPAGFSILSELRSRNLTIPVIVYSGCQDISIIDSVKRSPNTVFLSKITNSDSSDIIEFISSKISNRKVEQVQNPFIVHGQDNETKLALKNYLQNTLKLPEPIILHEHPSGGKTIIEKFEHLASLASVVFVLLTPDDKVANPIHTTPISRSRQNVIFELGYFLGKLGRTSGKVLLLYKGPLELPSDVSGIVYIDISNGIDSAGELIRKEVCHS